MRPSGLSMLRRVSRRGRRLISRLTLGLLANLVDKTLHMLHGLSHERGHNHLYFI